MLDGIEGPFTKKKPTFWNGFIDAFWNFCKVVGFITVLIFIFMALGYGAGKLENPVDYAHLPTKGKGKP